MLYSFRIKIVAVRLRTTSPSPLLTLRCTFDSRLLAERQIKLQDGLLVQNTTLSFHLDAASLALPKPIVLRFCEQEITSAETGTVAISIRDFDSVKMRKFAIATRAEKEQAYVEAFLLKLQSREETAMAVSPPTVRTGPFRSYGKAPIDQSHVRIEIDNSICISGIVEPESPRSLGISTPTLKKVQSQEAETQTYNIESLLTLNSILEQANAALEKEKQHLLLRVKKLQATLENQQTRRHIDHQYKLRIEQMHDQIERLKQNVRQAEARLEESEVTMQQKDKEISTYQLQISKNTTIIDDMKQHYEQEICILREKQALTVKELNIDEMMLELTKYSETAKRYKNNAKETSAPVKLNSLPQNRSSVKDFLKASQRSQSRRPQSKPSLNKYISGQQTLDSMTESKVFM